MIRNLISIAVISFALWTIRLVNELIVFPSQLIETLWLMWLRPVFLFALSLLFVSRYVVAHKEKRPTEFWKWSFAAAALFCLAYVPDMHASFTKAGEKRAVLFSAGFYALGILTYGFIRGGITFITLKLIRDKIRGVWSQSLLIYPLFLFAEFLFFHTWHPITYFPALPAPIPIARFDQVSMPEKSKYILFETMLNGEERRQIQQGGELALTILSESMIQALDVQLPKTQLAPAVVVILPETFVSVSHVSELETLVVPVAMHLFETTNIGHLVWIQGIFLSDNNVVVGGEIAREEFSEMKDFGLAGKLFVVRKKNEHMPMFEAISKGITYSSVASEIEKINEQSVPESKKHLKNFLQSYNLMICYESLFPHNWKFGRPSVVLTNHHLFNEYRLMNAVYFGFVRQLSFLFDSRVKVVSNYNPSGVLHPNWEVGSESKRNVEDWLVVRYPQF